MVPLTALWLLALPSAVIVFVASSIMHMLLACHRSDYQRLPALKVDAHIIHTASTSTITCMRGIFCCIA
jgi:hypothetical protein